MSSVSPVAPAGDLPRELLEYPDRVADLFIGKTVLITGGTGFMGKVLIEKILRCCGGVKRVLLLVRPKKGRNPQERLQDIFSNPVFDLLKRKSVGGLASILEKVQAIDGDVSQLQLGLGQVDRQMLEENVQIIFHCAATIRFDEALKKAVLLNVRGTKMMLDLAKRCPKLEVFAHLSTSYCHLHERILYERAYPPPADPHHVIESIETMSDEMIEAVTAQILDTYPNTYSYTKALGEALVNDEMDALPVIILRPSVVVPMWRDPLPGWTDNLNGPTGLLIGAGKGVLRTMYCKGESYADFVPVDVAVNAMLCCCTDFITHKGVRRIYNTTSSAEHKVPWEQIIQIGRDVINTRMPFNWVVWYPGGSMKKSRLAHNIAVVFCHWLPAIVVDAILMLFGQKPILTRVQNRIQKGFEVFEYYANNQWDFNNDGSLEARSLLNPRERATYKVDGEGIDYHDYFTDCTHAARLYILHESDESIPMARRHMKIMWFVDFVFKWLFVLGLLYIVVFKVLQPILL